jgi:hypothetical protein
MTATALDHITFWTFVGAIGAMALKDALGVLLVICEAKGKAIMAGLLDAGSDVAGVLVTLVGAGEIIIHGWTLQTIGILVAISITSFFGTAYWTRVGSKIGAPKHSHAEFLELADRLAALEAKVAGT